MSVDVRVSGALKVKATKEVKSKILYVIINTLSSITSNTYISMLSDLEGTTNYEEFLEKAKEELEQEEIYFYGDARNGYENSIEHMKFWIEREIDYLKEESKEGGRNENKDIYELALSIENVYNEIKAEPAKLEFDYVETDNYVKEMNTATIEFDWASDDYRILQEKEIDPELDDLFRYELFSPEEITLCNVDRMREAVETVYGGVKYTSLQASFLRYLPEEDTKEIENNLFKEIEESDDKIGNYIIHSKNDSKFIYTYEIVDAIRNILNRKEIDYLPDYLNLKTSLFKEGMVGLEDDAVMEKQDSDINGEEIIKISTKDYALEIKYTETESLYKGTAVEATLEYKGDAYKINDTDLYQVCNSEDKSENFIADISHLVRIILIHTRSSKNASSESATKSYRQTIDHFHIALTRLLRAYTENNK